MLSEENKVHLDTLAKACNHLMMFIDEVNAAGGLSKIDPIHEHAICDCITRLGDGVKNQAFGFDRDLQKSWSSIRVITAHKYYKLQLDLIWKDLYGDTQALLEKINEKLE